MIDLAWKLFITCWVALIAVSCGAGFASVLNPASHDTTIYNTTTNNISLNILSNNSEFLGVIGLTIVLIMIMRTLRGGGER